MKLPYSEGSVFLVPLRGGGYARGVVVRAAPKGKILLGYFFGPRLVSKDEWTLDGLRPGDAVLRVRFGDLGLIRGDWQILGIIPGWNRSEWPMSQFVRRDPLGQLRPKLIEYSDDDPSRQLTERLIDNDAGLQSDSLSGYGAVSIMLDDLLR
jgi:hypothetical protein